MKQAAVLFSFLYLMGSSGAMALEFQPFDPGMFAHIEEGEQDGNQDKGEQDDGHQDDGKQDDGKQDDGHQDDGAQDDKKGGHQDDGEDYETALFNVACFYYDDKNPEGFKSCKANAVFEKAVTLDGGEVADESPEPSYPLSDETPRFMVECDNTAKYNGNARRFTDLLSTRIHGLSGPYPVIYLPRGALHTGPHVANSYLEIDTGVPGNRQLRTAGKCYIWTGAP